MSATAILNDFNDTHKRHEALVVKVGAHAEVLTVTGKVVPLVNINTTRLVCHNLKGGGGGWVNVRLTYSICDLPLHLLTECTLYFMHSPDIESSCHHGAPFFLEPPG